MCKAETYTSDFGHEFEQAPGDSERQGAQCAAVHGVAKSQTLLSD